MSDVQETRELEISDFRNLGLSRNRGPERLLLNRSLSRGRLGGLVLLIGSNNSGKSNVLDAMVRSVEGGYVDSDINDFTNESMTPCVRMRIASGRYDIEFEPNDGRNHLEEAIEGTRKILGRIGGSSKPIDAPEPVAIDTDLFEKDYGYRISNRVIRYRNHPIKAKDLKCAPKNPNHFMRNLLRASGMEPNEIGDAYSDKRVTSRVELESRINKALSKTSKELNDLLGAKGKGYSLEMRLERSQIEVSILANGNEMNLDRQSEGFRWLFDFYFDMMPMDASQPGTMIIIDEYGDRLNCQTLRELTSKLRALARAKGLTFVFATQNPMAVDAGHLEEVRMVVPRNDGSSSIINDFDRFGSADSDIAASILNSMLISRNFMRRSGRRTVFVEDPKAYLYLNAFAQSVFDGKGDVDFIPVTAISDPEIDPEGAIELMKGVERIVTVVAERDSALYHAAVDSGVNPFTIGEIADEDSIADVEAMFSEEDRESHSIRGMSVNDAASFAAIIPEISSGFSDETLENFERAIDYVSL